MKVEVYWNLHKDCFSVRDCKTGRVIKHAKELFLTDVKFVVRQAGRRKVLQEKRKNVHAFVRGNLVQDHFRPLAGACKTGYATYNPYKYETFVDYETKIPLDTMPAVNLYTVGINGVTKKGAIQWAK